MQTYKNLWKLVGGFIISSGMALTLFGCSQNNYNNQETGSTIYTALPSKKNKYYLPFNSELKKFSNQMAHADSKVVTITNQKLKHSTSHFTYDDVWLRDVAPVITTKMVKFRYSPRYLAKADRNYLNKKFIEWLDREGFRYQTSKLVLDGGNVVWNGGDTVVLTKHVLSDNPEWSRRQIISELKYRLAVKHVVIIPTEPGDILGHADGMVKFINKRELYVSDFSGDKQLVNQVKQAIRAELPNVKFVILPSAYTDKNQYDAKIASAKGLYINMLETPTTIFVPHYGLKADRKVLAIIKRHTSKKVVPIDVARISTMGGSIHCLTWDVPERFMNLRD